MTAFKPVLDKRYLLKISLDFCAHVATICISTFKCSSHFKTGAKVLSARLAKVLNLLITSLTTCLCNAKEHLAKSGEIRQRTTNRVDSVGSR